MKHIRQLPLECLPTSIAMLLGTTPRIVIGALAKDGESWASNSWDYLFHAIGIAIPWASEAFHRYHERRSKDNPLKTARKGRGLIFIRWKSFYARELLGHAVAFENRRIFDPADPSPVMLHDYVSSHPQNIEYYVARETK